MISKKVKNVFKSIKKIKLGRRIWELLSWYRYRRLMKIDDATFAKITYKQIRGEELNLDNPALFNEKLWTLKLLNRDPLLTQCTDKYLVRDYVEKCGIGDILIDLYGVFERPEEINFDELPEEVFIKCNHTCGYNLIYNKNKNFDYKDFYKRFGFALKQNHYWLSREWNYKNIPPRIVCEKVLRDSNGNLPEDYKFMCFDGKPELVIYSVNIVNEDGEQNYSGTRYSNVYDMNFKYVPMKTTHQTSETLDVSRPKNFDRMIKYASILSKPFPHCRVDLYNIEGAIYFGELTFYHAGGYGNISPMEWAIKLGNLIDLNSGKIVLM
ncbi:glycosyl transferase [Tissierella creatinini]|nr:glycosyl transferase [Tissierella creatinini]TJX61067.1 glycosyl transferase [Soehngenia saccharolytica]